MLFHADSLSFVMLFLVVFLVSTVGSFGFRYLRGDARRPRFLLCSALLLVTLTTLFFSDHLLLFVVAWGVSNKLLVKLMVHKEGWKAAKASGGLATKNFVFGLSFIALGLLLLYLVTGETSIQSILQSAPKSRSVLCALIALLIGAMTQSAIWPFHRWLLSSLNSPTPVSALMHAGLINGGGFLLVRFGGLYLQFPVLLTTIFLFGIAVSLLGSTWKLLQHDVKRMLACSTMGQMGFMFAQCGLGLFAAAISHLCWHGIFKAYLFLSSGSVVRERSSQLTSPSLMLFVMALLSGCCGVAGYSLVTRTALHLDATLFIALVVFLLSAQGAMTLFEKMPLKLFFIAPVVSLVVGAVYGFNLLMIERVVVPSFPIEVQRLTLFHWIGAGVLLAAWISSVLSFSVLRKGEWPPWLSRAYMWMLNSSQPHPATITAHRNQYKPH